MTQQKNPPGQFQRTLTALAASILVFYIWVFVYQRYLVPKQAPQTQPAATATAPEALTEAPTSRSHPAGVASTRPTAEMAGTAPANGSSLVVVGGTDTVEVTLGSAAKDNEFPMALTLSTKGASAKEAQLRGYYLTVKRDKPYLVFQPLIDDHRDGEQTYSFETVKVRFPDLNQEVQLGSTIWKKEQATKEQAVFSVQINLPDGKPLARVVKSYTLKPQPLKPRTKGQTFDVLLSTRIENLTAGALKAVLVQQGPVGFRQEQQLKQEDREVIIAVYDNSSEARTAPAIEKHFRTEITEKELRLGRDVDTSRIAWVAEANQYFTCIMAPQGRSSATDPIQFERADAVRLTDRDANEAETSQDMSFRWATTPVAIAPGQAHEVAFDCYVGPKSQMVFESVDKYKARNYWSVISANFYACAPTALVRVMMWLLDTFHRIPPYNYGIAIFLLVILVRALLHPIMKKSQVNMMRMQKQMSTLQPKIQAVKEKYGNDKAMLNQETMKIYQEAGVNPAGSMLSCIPMMLQIPIWAALWQALNSIVEMRHAPLDGWWIKDLTQPDAIFALPASMHFTIPILGIPVAAINLLPILLALSQLLQAKYMPRGNVSANSAKPDQMEQQRKMMMFMSLFFFFMFYNMPSGLNFYIMCSNFAGIIEQKRIRQHLEKEEKEGKFVIAAKKPRSKGWFMRKYEQLQKDVEEAKQIQTEKKKK